MREHRWDTAARALVTGLSAAPEYWAQRTYHQALYHVKHNRHYWQPDWRKDNDAAAAEAAPTSPRVGATLPQHIVDEFERNLPLQQAADLLPKKPQYRAQVWDAVRQLLLEYYPVLRSIFRRAASMGAADRPHDMLTLRRLYDSPITNPEDIYFLTQMGFRRLLIDVHVLQPNIPPDEADAVFGQCSRLPRTAARIPPGTGSAGACSEMRMDDFLCAVLRLASARYPHLYTLPDRLHHLIRTHFQPHAPPPPPPVATHDDLVASITVPSVQSVFSNARDMLSTLFYEYSALARPSSSAPRASSPASPGLPVTCFLIWLFEFSLLDDIFSVRDGADVFVATKSHRPPTSQPPQLDIDDFVEAACRVALVRAERNRVTPADDAELAQMFDMFFDLLRYKTSTRTQHKPMCAGPAAPPPPPAVDDTEQEHEQEQEPDSPSS